MYNLRICLSYNKNILKCIILSLISFPSYAVTLESLRLLLNYIFSGMSQDGKHKQDKINVVSTVLFTLLLPTSFIFIRDMLLENVLDYTEYI